MGAIRKGVAAATLVAVGMSAAAMNASNERSRHANERGPAPPIQPSVSDELRKDFDQYNNHWKEKKDKERIGKYAVKLVLVSKDSNGKKYPGTYECPPNEKKHEKATVYTPETRYPGFCAGTGAIILSAESVKTRFDTDEVKPENWRTYVVAREVTRYWNQGAFNDINGKKEQVKEAGEHYVTCLTGSAILDIDGYDPLVEAGKALVNRTYVPEEQTQRDLYLESDGGTCRVTDFYKLVA